MTDETTPVEVVPLEPDPQVDSQARLVQAMAELKTAGDNGAKWFFWIAGLSLVNTLIAHLGGNVQFVVGLGITFIVDAVAAEIGRQHPEALVVCTSIAITFSLFVSTIAALFGWMARRRWLWAFGFGMAIYLLDGLLFLLCGDLMSAGFHVVALYSMIQGFNAYRKLNRIESALTSMDADTGVPVVLDGNQAIELA